MVRSMVWKMGRPLVGSLGLALMVALGCGGGGLGKASGGSTGGTTATGTSQTQSVGIARVTVSGNPQPFVVNASGQVSVLSQVGGVISNLTVAPTPNINSTSLFYSAVRDFGQIYRVPSQGGASLDLTHNGGSWNPSCAANGLVAYTTVGPSGLYWIDTMNSDGSGQTGHFDFNAYVYPTISPDGSMMAYVLDGNLYTYPVKTNGPTKVLYVGQAFDAPVWAPSGTQLAFAAQVGSAYHMYTISSTGANLTDISPTGTACVPTDWSPDGNTILYQAVITSQQSLMCMLNLQTMHTATITPPAYSDQSGCFSPDGRQIAYYRTTIGGATSGIYIQDFDGENPELLVTDVLHTFSQVAWSKFPAPQTFVGSNGTFGLSAASGFLLSQSGSQFASLVTFTSSTPPTATITAPTLVQTAGPLIYTLSAGSLPSVPTASTITNLTYTNAYSSVPTSVNVSSAPLAVVSVDGLTGQVDLVAPAVTMNRSANSVRGVGSSVTYTGKFTGVYDGTGKNLAPGGAQTIQLDPSTGKLISFR